MRLVFQFPASITSVVDAPRLVSSDASPTRPECAVGDPALDASGLRSGGEPQPDHLRRQRHHPVARLRARGLPVASGGRARRRPSRTARRSPRPPDLSCCGARVTSTPSPSVASTTSAQRSALTSLRRIPAMNSSPAIAASRRPRSMLRGTPRPRGAT